MHNGEIIELFNSQRERDYQDIEKGLDGLERRVESMKKGSSIYGSNKLSEQLYKLFKKFESIRRIDFFSSKAG